MEANYNIVVVLPYIDMSQPWVYMCSPSWVPLPPPSPSHQNRATLLFYFFFFLSRYLFIFNWLMAGLQYWFDFYQHELTIGVHMSPPSWISLLPPALLPLSYYRAPVWVLWLIQQIAIGCLITYVAAYASMLLSPFILPSPSSPPPLSLMFSMSASQLLLC